MDIRTKFTLYIYKYKGYIVKKKMGNCFSDELPNIKLKTTIANKSRFISQCCMSTNQTITCHHCNGTGKIPSFSE